MGISIWQLAIIVLIVVLIFGSKRFLGIGKDLGGAVKEFRESMDDDKDESKQVLESKNSEKPQEKVEDKD